MRIIAGLAKGKKIKTPKTDLRPLTDRAKESLFNIIRSDINNCIFLDLFAGSGNVGIEALSRGAKFCVFVESDKRAVKTIYENLEITNFSDLAEVYSLDVLKALKVLEKKEAKFDFIFIGAPYPKFNFLIKLLNNPSLLKIIKLSTNIIVEYYYRNELDEKLENFFIGRKETYGQTTLSFLINKQS